MVNLEEARKELEAILSFDSIFLAEEYSTDSSGLIGYIIRQCRKQELLEIVQELITRCYAATMFL